MQLEPPIGELRDPFDEPVAVPRPKRERPQQRGTS